MLVLAGRLGGFARDIVVTQLYGVNGLAGAQEQLLQSISIVLAGLVNVGSLIWLFVEAKAKQASILAWPLLGLFFGLTGVIIFYIVQIYTELEGKPKTELEQGQGQDSGCEDGECK